ncbi:MAG: DUF2304 domain-containing protein [Patescibacteria group bacterium]
MLIQQIIGLVIIIFFVSRLFWQKRTNQLNAAEFSFWFMFWAIAALAVVFLREIDSLVRYLGFTASGINFLLYLAVVVLFYFIFRLRIRLAKMEGEITKVVKEIATRDKK